MGEPRIKIFKQILASLGALVFITIIALFFAEIIKKTATAQNQIKIYPTSYSIEAFEGITWENPVNAFSQDLPDNASLNDFNKENSAFVQEIIKQQNETATTPEPTVPTENTTTESATTTTSKETTTTTVPEETTTTTAPEETTTTTESTNTTILPEETTTTTEPISLLKKILSFLIPKVKAEDELTLKSFSSTSLVFRNFSLPEDFNFIKVENVQLRFSFAGKGEKGDKIIISYLYNNEWQNLSEIDLSQEISNKVNGGYFLYSLPLIQQRNQFRDLKIKFTYEGHSGSSVYLDSLWLEVYFGDSFKEAVINKLHWRSNEEPEFELIKPSKNNKLTSFLQYLFKKDKNNKKVILIGPNGKEIENSVVIEGTKIKINRLKANSFQPGRYELIIEEGEESISQEFTWGILAINTNKSIYLPNETAYLQMAVLNDTGHTICDANLELRIKKQNSEEENILSTKDGTIKYSGSCGPNNVTDIPDYYVYYQVEEAGNYQMRLINLDNGYEITDYFEVKEFVPFETERIGPTRIYPLANYVMKIKIKANEDFTGKIIENVPSSFEITNQELKINRQGLEDTIIYDSLFKIQDLNNETKELIWQNIDLQKGDLLEISYTFDAPDVSPYIYLLGPLEINDFQETRQWQIASDSPKVFKIKTGFYVGNGSSLSIKGLGFKPELVIIKPQTTAGVGTIFKSSVMPQNNVAYLGAATADLTSGDIRLDDDGFTVFGANANSVNIGHAWVAFAGSDCSQTGVFCLGAYYGSGSGTKSITTGFQPDLVIVKAATAVTPAWRSSAMPNNYAQFFTATNQDTAGNYFTTLDSNGFTVGASLNTANWFYYIAFKNVPNKITVGSYTGTGSAQNITSVGFKPNFVFVKNANASTAVGGVWTVTEAYGDTSYYFTDTAVVLNAITGFISNGFSVGTNSTANGSGNTIYYAAFGGAEPNTASGTFQMAHGSYIGNGNYLNITGLGFTPDLVIIKGDTTSAGVFKTKLMPYNYTAYLDAATANFKGGIISLNQDGFTLDNNATVNSEGVTYYWTAFGNAWDHLDHSGAADFMIGVYYGNAVDNRNIERLPFQPNLVVVKPNAATAGVFRTSNQSGDLSGYFAATAEAANIIQALNLDGFQIGTAANVNTSGTYYYYFAFKSGSNFTVGSYTGTGSSQNINIGFQPDYIWVKKTTATRGVLRTSALSGDGAFPFINVAKILNAITNIISNGFTVYTADETNTSGSTYRYVAWKSTTTYTPPTPTFKIKTGFYVGNGSSLSIKGLGFKPELVIIKPQTTAGVGTIFKSSVMPQNNVAYLGAATADLTTGNIRLDDDGFTVFGSNANSINVGHAWVAFAGSDCSQTGVFCLGAYYGSGSGTKSITTGFQPDLVIVKAATAVTPAWRSSAMPNNYAQFFTATNQDTSGSYFTTLDSTGFTVGASLNTANWFYYIAFKNIANKITVGSFTGTGSAQNITSVGFKPNFVFVKNANASTAVGGVWTVTEAYGNTSYYFTDTAVVLNAITGFISNGFSVGTNSTANGSGNTIYYAAFGGAEPHTASGTFQMAHGSYIGNGNYLNITGLGFTPDLVIIKGDTTSAGVFKTKLMPYNYTAYLDAATSNFQGGIISLNQDGFTLDNNATVNSEGVTYYWTAFGNAWDHLDHSGAADFMVGVYYGNAVDNRNIERLPFRPDLVVVKPNANTAGVFRTSNQSGDLSGYFAATAEASNIIQALNTDGFQIGTAANVNTSGTYYYYFAFKSGSNFTVGSYTGTGSSQNINVGFQPDHIWVKKTTATRGVLRTSALSGDGAFPFINVAKILNAITNITSNGFTVYTADETNTSGSTYRYVAWKNPVSYNLSAYRFYANTDSTDVGSPLGDLNTPITLAAPNTPFRLRILINIGTSPLSQDLYKFKLQYAQKSGSICGDDETFYDISTSTPISFYDNPTPQNGEALTPNANDPTDGAGIIHPQTYVEANNFTNYLSVIPVGQSGEWDFSLSDNNAPANTNYCLRPIKADGSLLDNYSYIPEIITAASLNTAPIVSNVKLNNQQDIDLVENSTTTIYATADLYDSSGCNTITSVTAKIYRSGVTNGKDCTENENNCYTVSSCSIESCNGNYASTTCAVDLWFNADPTDSGTPWASEYWVAYIEATDSGGLKGYATSPAGVPDVKSLLALSVDGSINYGNLKPGDKNDPLDKITTISATGNISMDVNLYGSNLCTDYPTCNDAYIPVEKQRYSATSSTPYNSGTSLLPYSPGAELELNCPKTTNHASPQTKNIYWGIEIPVPQKAGTYTGQINFTAIKNELPWP